MNPKPTDMTPREEQWLAEHNRREAQNRIKWQYRALVFWGAVALIWLVIRFSEPEKEFHITDYLFILMIVINSANAIREIIRNKRIAADRPRAEAGIDGRD